jgi:hypothetical protein
MVFSCAPISLSNSSRVSSLGIFLHFWHTLTPEACSINFPPQSHQHSDIALTINSTSLTLIIVFAVQLRLSLCVFRFLLDKMTAISVAAAKSGRIMSGENSGTFLAPLIVTWRTSSWWVYWKYRLVWVTF